MSAVPPPTTPAEPARQPILPQQVYTAAVPYQRRGPGRGALVAALVVAVVLLLGSVGATVAWATTADSAVPARFGIERMGGPGAGHGPMGGHMPGNGNRAGVPKVPGFPGPGRSLPKPSPAPTR